MNIAFRASRFQLSIDEDGDYINYPLSEEEYLSFVSNLIRAKRINLKDFEKAINYGVTAGAKEYVENCLPVEVITRRGRYSLAYGPLRPIG